MEEVTINCTIALPEPRKDWRNGSRRAQGNLVHRTLKKGAVTPQETDPDLPVGVQESLLEAWVGGGPLHGPGH